MNIDISGIIKNRFSIQILGTKTQLKFLDVHSNAHFWKMCWYYFTFWLVL